MDIYMSKDSRICPSVYIHIHNIIPTITALWVYEDTKYYRELAPKTNVIAFRKTLVYKIHDASHK